MSKIKSWIDVVSQNWQFEAYLSDFEKGAFLAAVEVFPGIASEGCFFHLSKRLDYHVKRLGLMQKYKDDTDFRIRVKKLAALAFIPVADVIPAFESLSTQFLQERLGEVCYWLYPYNKRLGGLPPRLQRADILPAPICMEVPEEPAGSHNQHDATQPTEAARNSRIENLITSYTRATAD